MSKGKSFDIICIVKLNVFEIKRKVSEYSTAIKIEYNGKKCTNTASFS